MKIIVGLGNPESEYKNTRHNAGVFVLRMFEKAHGPGKKRQLENAEAVSIKVDRKTLWLIYPLEYMNNSGPALKKACAALKLKPKPDDILLLHDELALPYGRSKLSIGRSSGGHKGVESVLKALKTRDVWRLRIGVEPQRKASKARKNEGKDYLLSDFSPQERTALTKQKKKFLEGIALWTENPEQAMNVINQK